MRGSARAHCSSRALQTADGSSIHRGDDVKAKPSDDVIDRVLLQYTFSLKDSKATPSDGRELKAPNDPEFGYAM